MRAERYVVAVMEVRSPSFNKKDKIAVRREEAEVQQWAEKRATALNELLSGDVWVEVGTTPEEAWSKILQLLHHGSVP